MHVGQNVKRVFVIVTHTHTNRVHILNAETEVFNQFWCFFAVLYECSTWTNKRCQYNNIILHFRNFHSSNQCIYGTRLHKCSKFGICFCQHGWCCHDNIRQDLGYSWYPLNHILVCSLFSYFANLDRMWVFTISLAVSSGTWLKIITKPYIF